MSSELCKVNKFVLMFQAFLMESSKEVDCFATIVVAIWFCLLHLFNLFSDDHLLSIEVTRAIACISLFFVVLRTLDLFYC